MLLVNILYMKKYVILFGCLQKAKYLLVLLVVPLLYCNKDKGATDTEVGTKGKMGVYFTSSDNFFHVTAVPVSVYIDNTLVTTWSGNTTTVDCFGRRVDFLVELEKGPHTFAFVASDGHYVDGNMSIAAGQCTYIPLNEDQFNTAKTNYGTKNGSLTFIRTSIPFNHTLLYVDNNYVGDITNIPYHQICGLASGQSNIVVPVSAGQHTYKAVDNEYNRQWTGKATIVANGCSVINF